MIDDLRRQLAPLTARRLNARQRRELADALEVLAAEQRRLADAETRIGHVARLAATVQPAGKGGRPKGSGAMTVRWDSTGGSTTGARHSGYLLIGRGLWHRLGEPARLDIQRIGNTLVLRPCGTDAGYSAAPGGNGMPRLSIGAGAAEALGLADGVYAGEIRDGAIYVAL